MMSMTVGMVNSANDILEFGKYWMDILGERMEGHLRHRSRCSAGAYLARVLRVSCSRRLSQKDEVKLCSHFAQVFHIARDPLLSSPSRYQ
jgi:hypothetical protein